LLPFISWSQTLEWFEQSYYEEFSTGLNGAKLFYLFNHVKQIAMKEMLLLCLLTLAFLGCAKEAEDGGLCTAPDFIGTYSGTAACDGDTPFSADVTIEERSGKLYLVDSDGQEYPLNTNGCKISTPKINILIASASGTGSLNGKELSTSFAVKGFGLDKSCTFKGIKP